MKNKSNFLLLPESNKRISQLAANDVNAPLWDAESMEELPYVQRVRRPRQVLQSYNYAHFTKRRL